jgi:hypothetical protein
MRSTLTRPDSEHLAWLVSDMLNLVRAAQAAPEDEGKRRESDDAQRRLFRAIYRLVPSAADAPAAAPAPSDVLEATHG